MGAGGQQGRLIVADGVPCPATARAPLVHETSGSHRLERTRGLSGVEAPPHGRRPGRAIVLIGVALTLAGSGGPGLAQAPAVDVAYVEGVAGRATASSQGTTAELDVLDPLNDGDAPGS
jgi:hypothetical protein